MGPASPRGHWLCPRWRRRRRLSLPRGLHWRVADHLCYDADGRDIAIDIDREDVVGEGERKAPVRARAYPTCRKNR